MQVYLANPRGFCAGVIMAVEVVDQLLALNEDVRPIFVYHEIVHNRHIVERFESQGVVFVDGLAEVPNGATVVFSAHGVSPAIRDAAKARNLRAIDATCPLVTKVHMEAIRYAAAGYQILLIGHPGHDEVVGTVGEVEDQGADVIQVVATPDDIAELVIRDATRLVYLTQTTLSLNDADVVISALKKRFPRIKAPPSDDICYATTNLQQGVTVMAAMCDLVIVVGSQNSSNSKRLTEIAEAVGTPAYLVDDASEIAGDWFVGVERVLLTSGASAPEDLVRGVLEWLINEQRATIQQVDVFDETIEFGLPNGLKDLMRAQGMDTNIRGTVINQGEMIERWLAELGGAPAGGAPVRLTVSASGVDGQF